MKKNKLYLLVALFAVLFTACSQEEMTNSSNEKSSLVSISTELPIEFAKTRALPTAPDHQLRCILEVWSQGETPAVVYRQETIGMSGDNIKFTFEIAEGTYDCLLWADFIAVNAESSKVTYNTDKEYAHYADEYYNTASLKRIKLYTEKKTFNNDARDAFFGNIKLVKTPLATSVTGELTRPFSKLIIKEANADNFALCKKMKVTYSASTAFNTLTGAADKLLAPLTYEGAPVGTGTDYTLFSDYIFTAADGSMGEINLAFYSDSDGNTLIREAAIPAGVPAKRNYRVNATGHLIGAKPVNDKEATVDITIDNEWQDEEFEPKPGEIDETMKVGSFLYKDGTTTNTYKGTAENPCVGIVFALGAGEGDAIANYSGTTLTGSIKGYAVAVKDATDKVGTFATTETTALITEGISASKTDFLGYSNTKALSTTDYPAIKFCADFNVEVTAANSGWYLPSIGQLRTIAASYSTLEPATGTTVETFVIQKQLIELEGLSVGAKFTKNNYWASTVNSATSVNRMSFDTVITGFGKIGGATLEKTSIVRPVITF